MNFRIFACNIDIRALTESYQSSNDFLGTKYMSDGIEMEIEEHYTDWLS